MGVLGGDRRYDYLLHAVNYGRELTPADNRRRLIALRSGERDSRTGSSYLPGEAPNAGVSGRMAAEQRNLLKGLRIKKEPA